MKDAIRALVLIIVSIHIIEFILEICLLDVKYAIKKFFDRANWQYHTSNIHKKIIPDKLTCQHKNCGHLSKTVKQLLMHHDKLEDQCVKEKIYCLD